VVQVEVGQAVAGVATVVAAILGMEMPMGMQEVMVVLVEVKEITVGLRTGSVGPMVDPRTGSVGPTVDPANLSEVDAAVGMGMKRLEVIQNGLEGPMSVGVEPVTYMRSNEMEQVLGTGELRLMMFSHRKLRIL